MVPNGAEWWQMLPNGAELCRMVALYIYMLIYKLPYSSIKSLKSFFKTDTLKATSQDLLDKSDMSPADLFS